MGGRKAGGNRLRLLLHPGKHVAWPKPSGRGRVINGCGEGERETTEVGHRERKGASLNPADPTLMIVKAVQPGPGCGQLKWAEEPSPGRYHRQTEGRSHKHLSSTQTTKAVVNKTGLRDCHSQRRRRRVPTKCHTTS